MGHHAEMAQHVSAVADDALADLDLTGVLTALRSRQVSPAELEQAALDRVDAVNPVLNAIVRFTPDALKPTGGPFAGVPSFVKDNEDLAGYPTTHGSRATPRRPMPTSSGMTEVYQAVGFSVLGKTTLPEFGLTATTEPLATGPTRNPRNPDFSTGGSSGGSAALVAAGAVPIAHANDGGGSIRIPAACCGLVGLKPTRGRLPMNAEMDRLPVRIAVNGVLTRSVRDTALFFAEAERVHPTSLPPIGSVTRPLERRLRIAVITESVEGLSVDPDVIATVEHTAKALEAAGHQIELIANPFDRQFAFDFLRYWAALGAAVTHGGRRGFGADFQPSRLEPFTRQLAANFRQSAFSLPATVRRLRAMAARYTDGIPGFDVVLSPVTGHPAPPLGHLGPAIAPQQQLARLLRYACFTPIQNVTGAPAISLPVGVSTAGLPIGVQLAAGFGKEALLLGLAYQLEADLGWR